MPLKVSVPDPHTGETRAAAWAWCRVTNFDHGAKTGRLLYEVYADASAAYSPLGCKPILSIDLEIKPQAQPAVYGSAPLISPGVPPVMGWIREPGTNGAEDEGEYGELTPGIDPVYGPAPLLRPAVPAFDELIAANLTAYGLLQAAVDQLGLDAVAEFAGGEVIAAGSLEV